jgi:secondary thiamine-phosphate synthase enzyme
MWLHRELRLPAFRRGFHLVTGHVVEALPELAHVRVGLLHIYIQHTSASITINENADPDVPADLEQAVNAVAPESFPYTHTVEGPDDMPAHVKSVLIGSSVSIPIHNGKLCLGTWQGIYLGEHRNRASGRSLVLTLQGQSGDDDV